MMGFLPRSGLVQQFIQPEAASRLGLIQVLALIVNWRKEEMK